MNNENNEDMTEEEILKASEAYLMFVHRFSEYVKEMDPDLWSRAREYAADFTRVPGVTVELVDKDEENEDRDNTKKSGSD
jgi:hypothetical protein